MRSASCLLVCAMIGYAAAPPAVFGTVDFDRDVKRIPSAHRVRPAVQL